MDSESYRIVYTESAVCGLEEKADYIALDLRDPALAEVWYLRLRTEILEDLARFPKKYPLYPVEKWSKKGVRQFVFRNDVVLYSVDDETRTVYVQAVCTKGRDLSAQLEKNM